MEVALLHYTVPPVVGGVEAVLASQANQMFQSGQRVRVLAGRGKAWNESIPVHIIPLVDSLHPEILQSKSFLDRGVIPEDFPNLVQRIHDELEEALSGVDVLIIHNVASLNKNLALTAALHKISQSNPGYKIVAWHHDLAWTTERYLDELHPGWPWDLIRQAWPGVNQVVVSQARQEELATLMNIPQENIQVIPGGVDLPAFMDLSPELQELVKRLDLFESLPLLLCPVRITRRKNLEQALNILAFMRRQMPKAALVITGPLGTHNPSNLEYMEELLRLRRELDLLGKAHFMAEYKPQGLRAASMSDFYRMADALIITSREEGFGIPIIEAGLGRVPIFCTDLVPLRALAGDFATYFSPDDNPAEVSWRIITRLAIDPLYQMRVKVREQFTWKAIYHSHIKPLLESYDGEST